MFRILICSFLLAVSICSLVQAQKHEVKPLVTGEIHTFYSDVLQEDRVLNVALPANYDPANTYPVMYVLDGTYDEDFVHISGLVQFFNLMFSMPQTIIVGIANVDRKRDFTHHTTNAKLTASYPTTGHSEKFIKALRQEIIPLIEKQYHTNSTRYVIGQSLGGLIASEILLKHPGTFTHYIITSPSLWWDDSSMLKSAQKYISAFPDDERYIYIAVGADETAQMIREGKELASLLEKSGKKKMKVDYFSLKGENHATILHNSVYKALNILFPFKLPE